MKEINKIFNIDIFKGITYIPDKMIDLVISDPPYNLKIDEWDIFKTQTEYFSFIQKWIKLIKSKLKDNATVYLYNTAYNSAKIISLMENEGFIFIDWITWYKKDGLSSAKRKFVNSQETITMFSLKPKEIKFNYDLVREPYLSTSRLKSAEKTGIKKNGKIWFPNPNGRLMTNVWEDVSHRHVNKQNGKVIKFIHKTIKPEQQIKRMILASSNEGDLVLDSFSGTGTTSLVAKKLKRNSIGFEINKTYYDYFLEKLELLKNENILEEKNEK